MSVDVDFYKPVSLSLRALFADNTFKYHYSGDRFRIVSKAASLCITWNPVFKFSSWGIFLGSRMTTNRVSSNVSSLLYPLGGLTACCTAASIRYSLVSLLIERSSELAVQNCWADKFVTGKVPTGGSGGIWAEDLLHLSCLSLCAKQTFIKLQYNMSNSNCCNSDLLQITQNICPVSRISYPDIIHRYFFFFSCRQRNPFCSFIN